ncbi:cyclophilin-like fold protein [Nostoc sp.]|uniref:cyclophilin-like fold protein n=1 Tax=Nostoc sp. TaxID=1180 RepID=UPI002FF83865
MTSSASLKMPTEILTKQADSMQINIKVKDKVVTATLIDSKTTQDFISLLPLTLTLDDYARTDVGKVFADATSNRRRALSC